MYSVIKLNQSRFSKIGSCKNYTYKAHSQPAGISDGSDICESF